MNRTYVLPVPEHVAIIMDGNGRWASSQGLPRTEGHREGAKAVRRAIEGCCRLGVKILTLYAFSSDNWKRPRGEVSALMLLFRHYLLTEIDNCRKEGVRISVIGRRDRLPASLLPLIEAAEEETRGASRLHLRLAVDYSARDAIFDAAKRARNRDELSAALGPDVDLLVRTAGEQRLSDFLLWECAYAEMVFLQQCWPEFDEDALAEAVSQYRSRVRNFGAVPSLVPVAG
jgi:undecaprenyl diphosphate synthase